MPAGGKRKGAGRPKGSQTRLTREAAERLMSDDDVTPLEVMVTAMRHEYQTQMAKELPAERDFTKAADLASKAAPYMHPRLSAVAHTGKDDGPIEFTEKSPLETARRAGFLMQQVANKQKSNGNGKAH